ncbi:MAG: LacI family DNA-binding transcriptional regulator [Acidimicrobiales bacterium]
MNDQLRTAEEVAAMKNVKKRPTIETVAKRAGVSRQTVSNAANAPHRLRPETLRRVLGTIDELGYRPSQAARSLRTRATHVIGCRLLPSNYGGTGGVLDRLIHALCDTARSQGYDVLTFSVGTDDEEIGVFDDLLRRGAVDGFVLTNTHYGDVRPNWLLGQGARFVAFGRPWGAERPAHSWVDVDGASGTREAVGHLVELGHSRIGFLGLPEGNGVGDDRFCGWLRAMESHGLAVKGALARAEDGITSGKALADQLMAAPNPPSALVCVSDAMAVGAMRSVEDRGLRVGRDVSVVGFDDSPVATVLRPRLTSVRQPIEGVAQKLVEVLLAELSGAQRRPSRALLAPWVVPRETSGEPRPAVLRRSGTEGIVSKHVLIRADNNRKDQSK